MGAALPYDNSNNRCSAAGAGEIDTLAPVITLDNLGTINNDTPTISGTSSEPAGTIITVILTDSSGVDTELSASVDGSGGWSVQSPVLVDGDYSVSASVTDEAGNSSQQTDDFILNTNAPSITINAIGETNDTTPTINGTNVLTYLRNTCIILVIQLTPNVFLSHHFTVCILWRSHV